MANSHQWVKASSLSRIHDHTYLDTPHSVRLLWMSDQPDAEIYTWQHSTNNRQTSILPVGFEPTIPANERPHTHALERAATGFGHVRI